MPIPGSPVRLWWVCLKADLGAETLAGQAGLSHAALAPLAKGTRGGFTRTWRKIARACIDKGLVNRARWRGKSADELIAWLRKPLTARQAAWCERTSAALPETSRYRPPLRALEIITRADLWRPAKTRRAKPMIPYETLKHFGFKRDPFSEPTDRDDLYMSKSMKIAEQLILETARRREMLALVGDIGSGKTTVARRAIEQLMASSRFAVAFVQTLHREKVNARTIQESLLMALEGGDAKIPSSPEKLTHRVQSTVQGRLRENVNPVLVIDEAQALNAHALRPLKRLREVTGVGFKDGCAVILIGQTNAQPDLRAKLALPTVKEVADRLQIYHLEPLNGELGDYVEWRMRRGGTRRQVVTAEALKALAQQFKGNVTPLVVKRVLTRALIAAWQAGQRSVSGEMMYQIFGEQPDLPDMEGGEDA